jgi:ribonuclease HI
VSLVAARGRSRITWQWVKGHNGTEGNERVDEIAVAYSLERDARLYRGPLASYGVRIAPVAGPEAPPAFALRGQAARTGKAVAHSYLSVVDGVLTRHTTWADCERRVKGRAGARFKKTASADDERAIRRSWGFE